MAAILAQICARGAAVFKCLSHGMTVAAEIIVARMPHTRVVTVKSDRRVREFACQ